MFAPDYAHWHGTYEVAKHFYSKFIPELRELAEHGRASGEEARMKAAEALERKLEEVLSRDEHKWYTGSTDPAEKERRQKAAEEFKKRYEKN